LEIVYLDTTIPNHYYDERIENQVFSLITQKWWNQERYNYNIVSSDYTLIELNRGNYPNKEKVLELFNDIPLLPYTEELDNIADVYMKEFVMPKGAAGDAFHLACASFYKIDYLITWNCNHLANANKEQHIKIVNAKLSLFSPKIITPLQLFREKE